MDVVLEAKSPYGRKNVSQRGKEYDFIKVVEKISNGDFLILVKSKKDNTSKMLVNIESDKDFIVRFN